MNEQARLVPVNGTGPFGVDEVTFFLYDHLGNTRVTYTPVYRPGTSLVQLAINTVTDFYPYGKVLRAFNSGEQERYLTTQHEWDAETGLDYRGARFYDADVARFLSLDPLAKEYPDLSDYSYVGGNPIIFIDPDGRYFVGINNKKVRTRVRRDGTIKVGRNASDDLKRYANAINNSGSKTAKELFMNVASNNTKTHFNIESERFFQMDGNTHTLRGISESHNENGNKLTPVPFNDGTGRSGFSETLAYITNKDGSVSYKEVSITLYEKGQAGYNSYEGLNLEERLVVTGTHESVHASDSGEIEQHKSQLEGNAPNYNVETKAYAVERRTINEIKGHGKDH